MAVTNQREASTRSSSRGRASAAGSKGSTRRKSATSRKGTTARKSAAAGKRQQSRATSRTRSTNGNGPAASALEATRSVRRHLSPNGSHNGLKTAGLSAVSATLGIAGGVVLGRTALQRRRKLLGIPLPTKVDVDFRSLGRGMGQVAQQVGEAGRQLGQLAGEVKVVREKAEQVGTALK